MYLAPSKSSPRKRKAYLVQLAPQKASAHDVFTVFSNSGGWSSQGLSFFVGLIGTVFAMFGKPLAEKPSSLMMAKLTAAQDVIVQST